MAPFSKAETHASQASIGLEKVASCAGMFPRNGPDSSARSWGHDASGVTFSAQYRLPKQPVPTLEGSCTRYLEALRPLQSAEEHEVSTIAARRFFEGEGVVLQEQLEAYDQSHDNYFEHFCYEAFLGDDSPVVLNSNAFCSFKQDPGLSRNDQITRATNLVRSAAAFSQAIRKDRLQLDEIKGVPQCMNQYWWLFGVARVPEDDGGRIRLDADATHIVVLCRGQIYRVDVIETGSNHIIDEHALSECLQNIVSDAQDNSGEKPLGLLTTENQMVWSRCRKTLVNEGLKNGKNFSVIDSSLFALCLDHAAPRTDAEICKNMICGTNVVEKGLQIGTCLNRWYDKLAIIVCENGAAGMNFEHTCSDGSVDISLACGIYEGSISRLQQPAMNGDTSSADSVLPLQSGLDKPCFHSSSMQKLEWDVSPQIEEALHLAQQRLINRIDRHQLETLNFRDYGATFIKSVGFSPDAFFQMTLQAAYYSAYKQIRSGFEPVVIRQFLHGRTDVVRSTTSEAVAFAKLYADEKATAGEKIEAMRRATEAHVALSKNCAKGYSHHRHLYVLQQMWKRRRAFMEANKLGPIDDKPTIFTDPGWSRLGTTILMGSNVDNPCLAYAGFGPAADEGFTVVYAIRKDHIALSVTTRNGEAERFIEAIERTFGDLKKMLQARTELE